MSDLAVLPAAGDLPRGGGSATVASATFQHDLPASPSHNYAHTHSHTSEGAANGQQQAEGERHDGGQSAKVMEPDSPSPSDPDAAAVAAAAGGSVPQLVSEQSQAAEKEAAEAQELASAGFFKQTLAKVRSNLCGPLHVGDAVFTAWILLWIIVTGATKSDVKYLWLIIFLASYLAYLHWNWKSNERVWVWTLMDVAAFEQYWKQLRAQTPTLCMRTESWHWQRRVHHSTTYNGSGYTTTTSVTYVRAVTHTETLHFAFRQHVDLSRDVEGSDLHQADATFLHLWKEYSFADVHTALQYYAQLTALKQRNVNRDANMDTLEWMEIPSWMPLVSVYRDAASRPLLLRNWIFALCCVMLLSWPIKIYTEWAAKKGGFTMKKQVTA